MLYRLLFIFILFLAPTCLADTSDLLLYQDAGHLKLLSLQPNAEDHQIQIDTKRRYWNWERVGQNGECSSKIHLYSIKDELHITFDIDLPGPDWLYLYLIDKEDGISLKTKNTKDGSLGDFHFQNYDEMEKSQILAAQYVICMVRRINIPFVLELEDIAILQLQKPIVADVQLIDDCNKIVERFNDPVYKVRQQAYKEICNRKFIRVLPLMSQRQLAVQQRVMVDKARARYALDLSDNIQLLIEKAVRAKGVW